MDESLPNNMTDDQMNAYDNFQSIFPNCRLHGSIVYGLSNENSDVDVCVDDLYNVYDEIEYQDGDGYYYFDIMSNQLEQRIPRLVLKHRETGVELDLVSNDFYEPEFDQALINICKIKKYKIFLKKYS